MQILHELTVEVVFDSVHQVGEVIREQTNLKDHLGTTRGGVLDGNTSLSTKGLSEDIFICLWNRKSPCGRVRGIHLCRRGCASIPGVN